VWRQALGTPAEVELEGQMFRCERLRANTCAKVILWFDGQPSRKTIRDTKIRTRLEQNPEDGIALGAVGRPAGAQVMQFLSAGRYLGNVVTAK